jgi:hypothetical protein
MALYRSLSEADEKTRDRVEALLADDESLRIAAHRLEFLQRKFDSGVLRSLADKMDNRKRIAITDSRIIKFGAGFNRQSESYELSKVSSVDHSMNKVSFDGTGVDVSFRFQSIDRAEEFATEARAALQ